MSKKLSQEKTQSTFRRSPKLPEEPDRQGDDHSVGVDLGGAVKVPHVGDLPGNDVGGGAPQDKRAGELEDDGKDDGLPELERFRADGGGEGVGDVVGAFGVFVEFFREGLRVKREREGERGKREREREKRERGEREREREKRES